MHSLVQKILETCERVANIFLHPGANYTYLYNLHTVCKSAHVNGALDCMIQPLDSCSILKSDSMHVQRNQILQYML